MAVSLRLFSIAPRISKQGKRLYVTTAWRVRMLTLGTLYRCLQIDPSRGSLLLSRRYFWFFTRQRRIPFRFVEAITYSYQDWALGSSLSWAHDSTDLFSVGLKLHGGEEVHLFWFYGEGTFANHGPWPDWLYWDDYLFDLAGSQERESKAFVELLSRMIGVSVVPGRP